MEAIETIEYKSLEIKIFQDDYPEDPREWDNIGIMVCDHREYTLGDKKVSDVIDKENCSSWEDVEKELIKEFDPGIILPLYLYDHSGLSMKIGSFQGYLAQGHAEFDSGQVGFIYITRETILKEYGGKNLTKKTLKRAADYLAGEVENYDNYLSGNVYGYETEDIKKELIIDSCFGYYGDTDYMIKEAKSNIDYYLKERQSDKQNKLKALIQNKVSLLKRSELLTV